MKILIDADGCPVWKTAIEIAKQYKLKAVMFCDTSHVFVEKYAEVITVDKGSDSADFALVNKSENGDIVITQDYGLAAMCLAKGAFVITQNGFVINDFNIDGLLTSRHISKKARMSGQHLKGPSKRTKGQDSDFITSLRKVIDENINSTGQL